MSIGGLLFTPELGFEATREQDGTRLSFVNVEPINGFRYLFAFDEVSVEQCTLPGSVTGSPVGSDYRASDYQRGGKLWTVEARILTPLAAPAKDVLAREDFWNDVTGIPAPLVLVPPPADTFGWRERARIMAARLDLVRGAPLWVSFTRHGVVGDTVLTAVSDRRGAKVSAAFSLTFETLRIATSSRVPVPRLPRIVQQQDPAEAPDADLEQPSYSITDAGTLLYSILDATPGGSQAIGAAADFDAALASGRVTAGVRTTGVQTIFGAGQQAPTTHQVPTNLPTGPRIRFD